MTYFEHMQRCARDYFAALLVKHRGSVPEVVAEAGASRAATYKKLKTFGLLQKKPRRSPIARGARRSGAIHRFRGEDGERWAL